MRWRASAFAAMAMAMATSAVVATACGIDALGSLELAGGDDGGAGADGNGNAGIDGASADASNVGDDDGGDASDGDASPCVLGNHDNCGSCGSKCSGWAACEGTACVDVAAALQGARHEVPCTNDASPACSNAPSPPDAVVTLTGTAGRTYAITARFRGVLEQRGYDGDAPGGAVGENASFFTSGGTSTNAADTWNIYDVIVASPAKTFHLNSGTSGHTYADRIDYTATFQAKAGSTVTIHADSVDLAQARNRDINGAFILVPDVAPYPLPFYGQFVRIDVVSVQ